MEEDSTGKRKYSDVRSRSAVLTAALVVGLCFGVMTAERLYISSQERQHPARRKALQAGGGGGGEAAGAAQQLGLRRAGAGKPRNDLEALLQRVAPQGEVLIAISNSNLLRGELQMWIDVSSSRKMRAHSLAAALAARRAPFSAEQAEAVVCM